MIEKISVIIITRNRGNMLNGCLESLVKQTHPPDEIIVVDNASTDNTKQTILSFKKKLPIKYFVEKQIGMPYAQNRGIREALGLLLLFLDDDCEADLNWVKNIIKAHEKYPNDWAIQGRTFSMPKKSLFSILSEFNRFISVQNFAKRSFKMQNYFSNNFKDELEFLSVDGNNFSAKNKFFKKNKILLDVHFYRGLDTDLGKQIISKNGSIRFCPRIKVGHWERNNLINFLEQRWHTGRTAAKIEIKWKLPSNIPKILSLKTPLTLLFFCKTLNQLPKFPILLALLFLDRVYRLNGYFYEKRVLSFEQQASKINHANQTNKTIWY